jgi:hypothetical protein
VKLDFSANTNVQIKKNISISSNTDFMQKAEAVPLHATRALEGEEV